MEWLADFFAGWPAWLSAITAVVTAATAITALTPTPKDDRIVAKILSVLNLLAGNVGQNKRPPPE